MVARAYSLLDGYIYGFALTKMSLPFETPEDIEDITQRMMEPCPPTEYPHLARFVHEHTMRPGYEFAEGSSTASTSSWTRSSAKWRSAERRRLDRRYYATPSQAAPALLGTRPTLTTVPSAKRPCLSAQRA